MWQPWLWNSKFQSPKTPFYSSVLTLFFTGYKVQGRKSPLFEVPGLTLQMIKMNSSSWLWYLHLHKNLSWKTSEECFKYSESIDQGYQSQGNLNLLYFGHFSHFLGTFTTQNDPLVLAYKNMTSPTSKDCVKLSLEWEL